MDDDLFNEPSQSCKEISLIPLINVIFLLLIFFLVAGTYTPPKDKLLDIPDSTTFKTITESSFSHSNITIDLRGQFTLNGKDITLPSLTKELEYAIKENPEHEIVIQADQHLHATHLISILQLIATLGGGNVAIATEEIS